MIINLNQFGNGGGSGPVDVPIATTGRTGVVKIGDGINVDSAGTISVQGGGGIEVVTELPASGTDGQIVVLNNEETGPLFKIIGIDKTDNVTSITAIGFTEKTKLLDYHYFEGFYPFYINANGSYSLYDSLTEEETYFPIGETNSYTIDWYGNQVTLTVAVTSTGCVIGNNAEIWKENIYQTETPTKKLYIWSDEDIPSVDIDLGGCVQLVDDYFYSEVEFHFDEIPSFEGSAFTICQIGEAGFGSDHTRYIQYTSGGTFEWVGFEQTITLNTDGNMHYAFDGRLDKYLISDGYIKIIGVPGDGSVSFITIDGSNILGYNKLWNGEINKNGWVEFGRRGIQQKGQHNYGDFFFTANGQQIPYKQSGINIWQPPYPVGGNKILSTPNQEGMEWIDFVTQFQLVDDLPPFADEGTFAIVNGGINYTPSNAFLAANTTSPDEKNNFNDNTEISHIGNGNYIYFDCNGELTTSIAKTFLFRIAMRTNENGDWNTSNLAYINVYREYDDVSQEHFYSWDMPPFDYKDDQGNDYEYSDSGIVDNSTTANTTSYLPLWKWWDGGYGYKFFFEYDNVADTLKVYLGWSDSNNENYGDVAWICKNHTQEFCEFDTDPTLSEVYVFKGGVWHKLGELTQVGV